MLCPHGPIARSAHQPLMIKAVNSETVRKTYTGNRAKSVIEGCGTIPAGNVYRQTTANSCSTPNA